MAKISDGIKNATLASGGLLPFVTNAPAQYAGKQREYFSGETKTFTQMYAKYASDFVECETQGLDPENPYNWQTRRMRFSDVVRPSSAIQRHFDDYKIILFADRDIEYITPGAKIRAMGSTWLVTNPMNASGSDGMGVIRRCNAVWNYLDYYGNVISEPIVVENERANANDSDSQQSQLITKGYFNVICQYNEATRQIDTNTRLILGSAAYRVTGFSDFESEFTGDYGAVRLLSFTVRYEEPNETIDDMENHVAGGKSFLWDIAISAISELGFGDSAQFSASSLRNGETVVNTEDKPVEYIWHSDNENVITVGENGLARAVGEGTAVITATLKQNIRFSGSVKVAVSERTDGVEVTSSAPGKLTAYESVTLSAAYFENGAETELPLEWEFSGADEASFSEMVSEDGKSVKITSFGYSAAPLIIKAQHGEYAAERIIELEGI